MKNKNHGLILTRRKPNAPDTLAYRVRAKLEISQAEFSKLLGVSEKTVGAWENGRAVSHFVLPKLEKLARQNDVTVPDPQTK